MPSPREIALAVNDRSKFDAEPVDAEKNPTPKEPDYTGSPALSPPDEKNPAK